MPPATPPPPSRLGRILLAHLGLILVLHLGRQLIDDDMGIFGLLFLLAFLDVVAFLVLLAGGHGRLGRSFLLAALLVFLIGFSDCATHLNLGAMH
ncbi:hypothetical protein [Hymenobacter sp. B81]|uniref:hypothetical protein n=1 Tax=Hymenobacter sp. B81 TaxID=3344878 RepID=UPI0037DC75A4